MTTKDADSEIRKLVGAVHALGVVKPSVDRAWTRVSALKVIDCVLSLNRRYDRFVVPRLDHFETTRPDVVHVRDLRRLIDAYSSPTDFLANSLGYHDARRAEVLSQVVDRLLAVTASSASPCESKALSSWAEQARPSDYRKWGIAGASHRSDIVNREQTADCLGRHTQQGGPRQVLGDHPFGGSLHGHRRPRIR